MASFLDLDLRGRAIFSAAFLLVQVGLVATGSLRPDGIFAFQMFKESSTMSIGLSRRIGGPTGPLQSIPESGTWEARDAGGALHVFRWGDRVRDPLLSTLGRPVAAAYGVDAQLFRLQKALDDVVRVNSTDAETVALVADVDLRRNGRESVRRRLESARAR